MTSTEGMGTMLDTVIKLAQSHERDRVLLESLKVEVISLRSEVESLKLAFQSMSAQGLEVEPTEQVSARGKWYGLDKEFGG